mgnify:FL=1
MTQQPRWWEKKFDEKFTPEWLKESITENHMPVGSRKDIKAFIREILKGKNK